MYPSLVTSDASACRSNDRVSQAGSSMELYREDYKYQINDACRLSLVFHTLGEEEKTLSGLASMGDIGVSNVLLLAAEIPGQMLGLDRVVSEPEELFGEAQTPTMREIGQCHHTGEDPRGILDETRCLVTQDSLGDRLSRDGGFVRSKLVAGQVNRIGTGVMTGSGVSSRRDLWSAFRHQRVGAGGPNGVNGGFGSRSIQLFYGGHWSECSLLDGSVDFRHLD